jgi:hypothetical protein
MEKNLYEQTYAIYRNPSQMKSLTNLYKEIIELKNELEFAKTFAILTNFKTF